MNQNLQSRPVGAVRAELTRKYTASRTNLLLVAIISLVNLFMLALNNSYFMFSASMPSFLLILNLSEILTVGIPAAIIFGVVTTAPYVLCWVFSKKHYGWMVGALIYFCVDCVFLLLMYNLSAVILDLVFHALVVFYLVTGVINGKKLAELPAEDPVDLTVGLHGENTDAAEAVETPAEELPAFDESLFDVNGEKKDGE